MKATNRGPLATIAYGGAVAGLSLFVALIAQQGTREVAHALAVAGPGLLLVAAFHLAPLMTNAIGWRRLLPRQARPSLLTVVRARWIAESINGLLPVAQVGGNVVRATALARRGMPAATAGASVVVDVTLNVLAQILFTVLGLGLLLASVRGRQLALPVVLGMAIMGGLLLGFYLTQRRGLFGGTARLLGRVSREVARNGLASDAAALDDGVRRLYADRGALVATGAWHLLSWALGAGEVWLGLHFLGQPVELRTALLMESLGQALRTAAFAVPGALGVQEGGYMLMGAAFGLGPQTSLALSLVKRTRELLLGLPGLAVWLVEGTVTSLPGHDLRTDGVGVVER